MFSEKLISETEEQFEQFCASFPTIGKKIQQLLINCSADEIFILKYLYNNMPLSDAANYKPEIFLAFAEHAARLRKRPVIERETEIPDEIFLDYVAFHRVNTEGITACREKFCSRIEERIRGMESPEAALEVNYWCAEEATYQSTDERTLSAEAVWKSAVGRCGEESVFTVNAMRSVGIPARQVYAHRWAHCDDNHAWVEVWCKGEWHFLGACEPEEILDRGWFCNASSRAMMINSRIYGAQKPDGMIIDRCGMTSAVNQLSRYAETVLLQIRVEDEKGTVVKNAQIILEILNYAEFVPVITGVTDENGLYSVETGKGSLFLTVIKNGRENSRTVDTRHEKSVHIILKEENDFYLPEEEWREFDLYAPSDSPVNTKKPSKKQLEEGEKKFLSAVQKRQEKTAKFPDKNEGKILFLSKGNSEQIRIFISIRSLDPMLKSELFSVLTEKDFRDCTAEILEDHAAGAAKWMDAADRDVFRNYILNPRVELEQPSKYRSFIEGYFTKTESEIFRKEPGKVWQWISGHIKESEQKEYDELVTVPCGCLRSGAASQRSKKILYVAVCRTFGIPARLHPADQRMQYMQDGVFRDVFIRENGEQNSKAVFLSEDNTQWIYLQNWSLSVKTECGKWKTLHITDWENGKPVELAPGRYRLITTNRLPNGNQFAAVRQFDLKSGETKQEELLLRKAELKDMLEEIPLEPFELKDMNDHTVAVSGNTVHGNSELFIWLETGKEPTEHILNELRERKNEFITMQSRIHLILKSKSGMKDPTFEKTYGDLPEIKILFDKCKNNVETIARRMYGDPDKLPLILVVREGPVGVYSASGYNVGTGDMLLRIMRSE